uniref:THAP domain-containing protein 6-like n=1 Tax=Acanthochromis polyacanthus TaxID=80966 RepID=A0A3Q1FHH0_9TELE
MPAHCAAYKCKVRRTTETRKLGITFHRFPRDYGLRRKWEVALRREGFAANDESVLCSNHFQPDEFDRAGQICRLRPGVIPSVFNFPAHLRRPKATRTTATSRKAMESLHISQHATKKEPQPNVDLDHNYSLPSSPSVLKARFSEAAARLWSMEKKKRNAEVRERRAKTTIKALLNVLKEKNLLTKELCEGLRIYLDLPSASPKRGSVP